MTDNQHDDNQHDDNQHDDNQYDVIVVGSGGGLTGAYIAASRGLRTLVIEKTEFLGGTTAYSGAGIWIPDNAAIRRAGVADSIDLGRAYLDAIVGDDSPAELREAFLQSGPAMIDELEQNKWFQTFIWMGVPDYFHGQPGALDVGRTIFPRRLPRSLLGDLEPLLRRPAWTERWGIDPGEKMAGGQCLIGRLLLAFMETGNGEIRVNTALDQLLVEQGNVVGVNAISNGERVSLRASRGVLLAAGGFERNRELRARYHAPITDEWTMGSPGNTGDALVAGVAVGAATALLDESWWTPAIVVPDNRPAFFTGVRTGIWVNHAGRRFMNENLPYDRAGHELKRLQDESDIPHIPVHWIFDQRQIDNRAFGLLPVDPPVPGWFDVDEWLAAGTLRRADTLEELAGQLGLPDGVLTETVEEYNSYAITGVDERFHRGETPWDRSIGERDSNDPTLVGYVPLIPSPGPNPCLVPVDQGPFYAVQMVLSDLGTKGGLVTDSSARVLREDGSVINGLYAAGNTMAPVMGRIYPGAGGPVASSMTFSYIAAVHMAKA
jgi:3-oxosteroid 1-dehydrogenase